MRSSSGCAIAAIGFGSWASKATVLDFGQQRIWVIVAGAGMGMMLGPANTDAVNRAGNLSYGEATGITQTIRNYGASLGLAALGTILLITFRSHLTASLSSMGVPHAATVADRISQSQQGSGSVTSIPHYVSVDFAHATQVVLYVMCGIMAVAGRDRAVRTSSADGRRPCRSMLKLYRRRPPRAERGPRGTVPRPRVRASAPADRTAP